MVGELLNLLLSQCGSVLDDIVVDRKCGSDCGSVSDHVEVKSTLRVLVLNQTSVNNCTWCRVFVVIVPLLSKSTVDSFVN